MDSELNRVLQLMRNRGALTNGVPTSETFSNLTDSFEALADALNIVAAGSSTGFEADGTGGSLWRALIAAKGTFTTSSATVPADTGRTEANNYWNGALMIPLTGAVVGQARLIASFANAGGVFTLDSELPFTAAPGLVEYIIVHPKDLLVPAADSAANQTPAHVIGNKSDTNAGNSLLARNLVPAADSTSNTNIRDVVGNKTDTVQYDVTSTNSSIIRLLRAIHRGEILAVGTLTTSSTTVPADTGRTEANDYWRGSWLMTVSGAVAFQPRLIVGFANAGGVFTLDADNIFTSVPGLVSYVILANTSSLNPSADSTTNTTPSHVVGNKADTASYARNSANSLMRYLKGVHTSHILTNGTFTTSSATVPADTGRTEANNYWDGCWLIPLTGTVALQPRLITNFANAGGVLTVDAQHPFTAAPGLVTYIIVSPNSLLVPGIDGASNATPGDVIGNKSDTNAGTSLLSRNLVPAADSASNTNIRDVVGNKTDTNAGNSILARQLVPAADSATNINARDVIGNKTDTNAGNSLLARNLVPAADSASNTNIRDVVGNKTDTNAGNSLLARNLVPAADSASNTNVRDVVGNKTDTNAGNSLLARNLIPTADVVTNVNMRDVIGGKADTANYDSGATSSLMRYMRGLVDQIKELKRMDLYPVLSEFWANDNTGIDLNMWTLALGSAGTVTRVITDTDFLKVRLNTVDAVDASTARLTTDVLFRVSASTFTTSGIPKRFVIQWEAKFTGVANIDNATFVMGLVPGTTSTRATNDIIAFALSGDAIQTVTDSGGVETTNLPAAITLTNRNEFRIEVSRPAGVNTVEFFINDVLQFTHTTNIPSLNAYWTAFTDNEAAAAGSNQVDIGAIVAKYFDVDNGQFEQ